MYRAQTPLTEQSHEDLMMLGRLHVCAILRNRVSNWTLAQRDVPFHFPNGRFTDLFQSDFGQIIIGVTFAGACYGGLHLIAWASAFPSRTEVLFWRAASVTISVTGPSCAMIAVIDSVLDQVGTQWTKFKWLHWLAMSVVYPALLWYTFCRTFIIVECFILLWFPA
jgi:hypothetical protein